MDFGEAKVYHGRRAWVESNVHSPPWRAGLCTRGKNPSGMGTGMGVTGKMTSGMNFRYILTRYPTQKSRVSGIGYGYQASD
jgi:hypothetical protein